MQQEQRKWIDKHTHTSHGRDTDDEGARHTAELAQSLQLFVASSRHRSLGTVFVIVIIIIKVS